MKLVIAIFFLFSINHVYAANYFSKQTTCLNTEEIASISTNFPQYKKFVTNNKKICKNQDIGNQDFEVIRTLIALKKLKISDTKKTITDDFSLSPIKTKDWWNYLTARADKFNYDSLYCELNPTIIAYVQQNTSKTIFLCQKFFDSTSSDQLHIIMHEARHFDGHKHILCLQGRDMGMTGACDNKITDGGSYAISVQSLVALSKSSQLSKEERLLSENSAIYYMVNRFNVKPNIKTKNYIYLSNRLGEIYRVATQNLKKLEFVIKLKSVAKIYSNGSHFTIIPTNPFNKAYRSFRDFKTTPASIGNLATKYNDLGINDKLKSAGFDYIGQATGFLKNKRYQNNCSANNNNIKEFNILNKNFNAIFSLKLNSTIDDTFLEDVDGQVYKINCDFNAEKITYQEVNLRMPDDMVSAFSFVRNEAYVLDKRSNLYHFDLTTEKSTKIQIPNLSWISATPLVIYEFFD